MAPVTPTAMVRMLPASSPRRTRRIPAWDWDILADRNTDGSFDPGENGPHDDLAIARDKEPLLPGQSASFANYTSYAQGINGIMFDLVGRRAAVELDLARDFRFRAGNSSDPSDWVPAPAPQGVSVRRGAGIDGSDRITLVWEDDPYDYNRDRLVNGTDQTIARNSQTNPISALRLINPPAQPVSAHDAVFRVAGAEESQAWSVEIRESVATLGEWLAVTRQTIAGRKAERSDLAAARVDRLLAAEWQ